MPDIYQFRWPTCEAEYDVVRLEAPPTHDKQLTCPSCGAPFRNRDGKFAFKYFRMSDGRKSGRMHKPRY
jgi:predicted nucleic acid-binding Zn ribbon protein